VDGPENENAVSPNFVRRRGLSNRQFSLDRKRRVDLVEAGRTMCIPIYLCVRVLFVLWV